ncbi:MAG: 6-phosphofructokinase [Anaerolineae bacterium]
MPGKIIGVLTAGGDCPGLNAAIRAVGKAARTYDMEVIGFLDGFRGLVENRTMRLENANLSGILTMGGTILGTSRDKPHRMPVANVGEMDMSALAIENYQKLHLDTLVCMGGGGTLKNSYRLAKAGLHVINLPKTIDGDVAGTELTIGFDTALAVATEGIDRLHTTADAHQRVIVVEIMGHNAGWLTLGAGIAGGADVILIPEIPYKLENVVEAIMDRSRRGKRFSIVAVAEGALTVAEKEAMGTEEATASDDEPEGFAPSKNIKLAMQLQQTTGLECRFTALGHLQRGGTPTATDRLLATRLGTYAVDLINEGVHGVMVAVKGESCKTVKLSAVAGHLRLVPIDHLWVEAARRVGVSLGD